MINKRVETFTFAINRLISSHSPWILRSSGKVPERVLFAVNARIKLNTTRENQSVTFKSPLNDSFPAWSMSCSVIYSWPGHPLMPRIYLLTSTLSQLTYNQHKFIALLSVPCWTLLYHSGRTLNQYRWKLTVLQHASMLWLWIVDKCVAESGQRAKYCA